MSPRTYNMERRAAAAEATRRRILEATMALHMEQGIHPTSLQEVAERANVALGTVYRHFPTVDELVHSCGELAVQLMGLPEPSEVPVRFEGARTASERLERLVAEVAGIYRDWAIVFQRVRESRHHFQGVARDHRSLQGLIDAFVDEALRPLRPCGDERAAVRALLDDRVWQVLLDRGLDPAAAERELVRLVAAVVARKLP
jgi:AcrR family transcriptional regulator